MTSLIAAMTTQRVIGKNNQMPWHLPIDLAHFKKTTQGHTVIMGHKTYLSLGKALPNRTNIVISRQQDLQLEDAIVKHNITDALSISNPQTAFIIGGATIYQQTLPLVDTMYLTLIDAVIDGDTYFPEWNAEDWLITSDETAKANDKNPYDCRFITYQRTKK